MGSDRESVEAPNALFKFSVLIRMSLIGSYVFKTRMNIGINISKADETFFYTKTEYYFSGFGIYRSAASVNSTKIVESKKPNDA